MTKQVKIYAGLDTYEKWQQICERFSSNTAAFAVVVENYFNQFKQEDTMNTVVVTLSHEDMINFVTGNGQQTVEEIGGEAVIEQEIERYAQTLANELGHGFEVKVSDRVLEAHIDGRPARYSDHAKTVSDAEAVVVETFW